MVVELYHNGKTSTQISEELGIGFDLVRPWSRDNLYFDWLIGKTNKKSK